MTKCCSPETVKSAVAIIESLIEVTEKKDEFEMAAELKTAKSILLDSQQNKPLTIDAITKALAAVKYFVEILNNLS